jgi:hypothetical protein
MIVRPPTPWERLWTNTEPVLPLLILDAVILIVAVVRRRRHPRASAFAGAGAGLSLLLMTALIAVPAFLPPHVYGYLKTFNIVQGLSIWALALFHALIGIAVFVGRPPAVKQDQSR